MLRNYNRRRMRMHLQMSIYFKAWFGMLFYPISLLLLLEKLSRFTYSTPLARVLHVSSYVVLFVADVGRYYLGTHGNLTHQVFHLTAFVFLAVCPIFPAVLYCKFLSEHRIPFDRIVGAIFLVLLSLETCIALLVLQDFLQREMTKFVRLRVATHELRDIDHSSIPEKRIAGKVQAMLA